MTPQQERYTLYEITDALHSLDVEAQETVLNALQQQAESRRLQQADQVFSDEIVRFAAIFERATNDRASDSNIEGWYEDLAVQAETFLELLATRPAITETEKLTQETAALTYCYLNIQTGSGDIDITKLVAAGVDVEELEATFRRGIVTAFVAEGSVDEYRATEIVAGYNGLNKLGNLFSPATWNQIVGSRGTALRAKLIETGVPLPELDENGEYDDFVL